MIYYVDQLAGKNGKGTADKPFLTISEAAKVAVAGDEIIVSPGIYREYVDPQNAGRPDARITYRSLQKGGAVITGAEEVKNWKCVEGTVWKTSVSNSLFGECNPYTTLIFGDWFNSAYTAHTGEVYLNGKSLYEVTTLDGVMNPVKNLKSWDPEFTIYTWYTEQSEDQTETILYANFQGADPNKENVEINVRENCFYPSKEGVGYLTFSGFTVRQAATQWAPPTAYQEGMVGPHWSKGWIIEDCEISHSKCSGISLGKYKQPDNDNKWSRFKIKDGTQTERENICQAQREGWTKERIGSHIVRRCNIHDCGQTGIVGHLGGVFSIIEENHIHHINNKQNLAGAEIGGIKMHAAIDVIIRKNHFHHCTRGLWLDWQVQGTRVTQNLFHDNCVPNGINAEVDNLDVGEDIFIEIAHGPSLVDNNIMLSDYAMKLPTQGIAVVHNLIAGSFTAVGRGVDNGSATLPSPRYTPYHVPHQTEIAGFMTVLHGDARFYNNIFVQKEIRADLQAYYDRMKDDEWTDANLICGTKTFENYPEEKEYLAMFQTNWGESSPHGDRYYSPLPVWAGGNLYFNGAQPMKNEKNTTIISEPVYLKLREENGTCFLDTNLYDYVFAGRGKLITTQTLGMAFEPEQKFENPDGTPITFDTDYFGEKREDSLLAGCFAQAESADKKIFVD